jgi:DNA polymerase-4
VTVKAKHADFQQITRRRSFLEPVASQRELERISLELLRPCFPPPRNVRLLGVTLSSLIAADGHNRAQLAFGLDLSVTNGDQVQSGT